VVAKPLYARQDELPPLPLPALESTLEKLLKSVRPLVTDEEYEHTEAVAKDFASGVGAELQRALEERAADSRNWLEDWWLEFIYLRPRWPIAVWINYVGANLADELVPYNLTQVQAAAMMTKHVLKFRHLVVTETLEPEKLAGRPLCMDQFSRMFNSCRVPGEECDVIETYPHDARHIVVMRNNALFAVDVLAADGSTLPDSDLMQAFEDVLRLAATPFEVDAHPAVSVLTSEERHTWAKVRDARTPFTKLRQHRPLPLPNPNLLQARQHLVDSHAPNKATLDLIEKAVFCVALERTEVTTLQERAHNALLGTGLNRWYDKPFTMVVYPSGITALNGEHTWADAMVIVKQQDYVMRSVAADLVANGKPVKGAPLPTYRAPTPLVFKLDATLHAAIELAATNIGKLAGSIDLAVMRFTHFGRGFMKRYGFTPDFFVQMALQLAHWRLHKEFVATYETGHTRLFYHGRTETGTSLPWRCVARYGAHHTPALTRTHPSIHTAVRSTSTESVAFCKAMTNPSATDSERFEKLKAAIEVHGMFVKDAMTGQAIDRHLLGLQIAAEVRGAIPFSRGAPPSAACRTLHPNPATADPRHQAQAGAVY